MSPLVHIHSFNTIRFVQPSGLGITPQCDFQCTLSFPGDGKPIWAFPFEPFPFGLSSEITLNLSVMTRLHWQSRKSMRRLYIIRMWKGPLEVIWSNPSAQAGLAKLSRTMARCLGLSPRMETLQPPWATCASVQTLSAAGHPSPNQIFSGLILITINYKSAEVKKVTLPLYWC